MKACDACHEYKRLTHRVKSDIINMTVCWDCGLTAERIQNMTEGNAGAMKITLFETRANYALDKPVHFK